MPTADLMYAAMWYSDPLYRWCVLCVSVGVIQVVCALCFCSLLHLLHPLHPLHLLHLLHLLHMHLSAMFYHVGLCRALLRIPRSMLKLTQSASATVETCDVETCVGA
jgi:hypothetical protein